MKRRFAVSSLISALLMAFVCFGMLVCPIYADVNPVKVVVDPRMELLSAVQLLSKDGVRSRRSFQYKQEMTDYFAPYKYHRAVILYNSICSKFFNYDAPPTLMLYVSDPPYLKPQWAFQSNVRRIADQHGGGAEGAKKMVEFVDALRDFACDSDFQKFYATHQDIYRAMISESESTLSHVDIVGPVEDYYGRAKPLRYTIMLVPLFHSGGYGPMLEHANGIHELYCIRGPLNVKGDSPVFGNAKYTCELAWHEFGHSFVNPLADKYWSSLEQYSSLYSPISDAMKRQAYGNWKTCINEHIVRAVEARIINQAEGESASEFYMAEQRVDGFAYVKPLCERLKYYENHRDKYPTFQSFYPQLIGVFKSLQKQDLKPGFYHVSPGEIIVVWLIRMYYYMPEAFAMILCVIIIPPAISATWAFIDARKRGKRGLPSALLVMFGIWPLGFIVWLFLRRRSAEA